MWLTLIVFLILLSASASPYYHLVHIFQPVNTETKVRKKYGKPSISERDKEKESLIIIVCPQNINPEELFQMSWEAVIFLSVSTRCFCSFTFSNSRKVHLEKVFFLFFYFHGKTRGHALVLREQTMSKHSWLRWVKRERTKERERERERERGRRRESHSACVRACVRVCVCHNEKKCQTNGKHDKRHRRYFK